jgi:hypothetical protein
MQLSRLWQPRRLLFWQWVMFNLLSSACTWALHAMPLNDIGVLLVGGVALLNVGFGLLAAWALVRDAPPVDQTAGSSASTSSTSEWNSRRYRIHTTPPCRPAAPRARRTRPWPQRPCSRRAGRR